MKYYSSLERQKQIQFALGIAALDDGKPSTFTQNLLNQYENGIQHRDMVRLELKLKYTYN